MLMKSMQRHMEKEVELRKDHDSKRVTSESHEPR